MNEKKEVKADLYRKYHYEKDGDAIKERILKDNEVEDDKKT